MKLIIHRGSREIGGSCVELVSGGTRILLDLGMPLVDDNKEPFDSNILKGKSVSELVAGHILPPVSGLYEGEARGVDAVLLSHAHQDHYGFLRYINPEIPVYMSEGTRTLIEISDLFIPTKANLTNPVTFEMWKPFAVGGLTVTPYLVDHSACDAAAFLIEGDGRRIFYSGDFRGHGRKGTLLERLIAAPPRDIDCLLLEGTMLGRGNGRYADESAVEEKLVSLFREKDNLAFVFCSSQNIDRLVSIDRAVKRSRSVFVIDLYTAYILDRLNAIPYINLPQFDWREIKVKYFRQHRNVLVGSNQTELLYKYGKAKIEIQEIDRDKKRMVMLMRDNSIFRACLGKLTGLEGAIAVYSMWEGYVTDKFRSTLADHGISYQHVHTSGHAVVDDLRRLADALNPGCVVPIHTFFPQEYASLFSNVRVLSDGEEFFI